MAVKTRHQAPKKVMKTTMKEILVRRMKLPGLTQTLPVWAFVLLLGIGVAASQGILTGYLFASQTGSATLIEPAAVGFLITNDSAECPETAESYNTTEGNPLEFGTWFIGEGKRVCYRVTNDASEAIPFGLEFKNNESMNISIQTPSTGWTLPANGASLLSVDIYPYNSLAPGEHTFQADFYRGEA